MKAHAQEIAIQPLSVPLGLSRPAHHLLGERKASRSAARKAEMSDYELMHVHAPIEIHPATRRGTCPGCGLNFQHWQWQGPSLVQVSSGQNLDCQGESHSARPATEDAPAAATRAGTSATVCHWRLTIPRGGALRDGPRPGSACPASGGTEANSTEKPESHCCRVLGRFGVLAGDCGWLVRDTHH
jgi:hypothetical protein